MLHTLSVISLAVSGLSFLFLAAEVRRHPQEMAVMNFVWPITALYFGPFALWTYFAFGRPGKTKKPFWQKVWVGVTHCGAGCTLGDFSAEWLAFVTGFTAFGSHLWGTFLCDFLLAYAFGIIFQYFSIAPMRNLSGWAAIWAAVKADTISLLAFEIGMFAFMAWMRHAFQPPLEPDDICFWFLMQIAMAVGFATSYPANWWLIRRGWKEAM